MYESESGYKPSEMIKKNKEYAKKRAYENGERNYISFATIKSDYYDVDESNKRPLMDLTDEELSSEGWVRTGSGKFRKVF